MNLDKLNQLRKEQQRLREQMQEQAQSVFKEGVIELFSTIPELESFAWTQYTDYWNDGEPCYFSAHIDEDQLYVNGWNGDGYNYEDGDYDEERVLDHYEKVNGEYQTVMTKYGETVKPLFDKIADFLNIFSEDDLLFMFGDHVKITVTENEINVDNYTDHD